METKSRMVGARGCGWGVESYCLMGTCFLFGKMRFWGWVAAVIAANNVNVLDDTTLNT